MPPLEAPWTTGCSPRKEFSPDKAFPSASMSVECVHSWLQRHPHLLCPAPRLTPALKLSRLHCQNFTCSAKPFLTASSQWCIPIQDPSGHPKAPCGSWGCPMAQRDGVGSVSRGVGKAWLRQQGPKPAWLLLQFPLGLDKAEGRALGCPCHTPKSGDTQHL